MSFSRLFSLFFLFFVVVFKSIFCLVVFNDDFDRICQRFFFTLICDIGLRIDSNVMLNVVGVFFKQIYLFCINFFFASFF